MNDIHSAHYKYLVPCLLVPYLILNLCIMREMCGGAFRRHSMEYRTTCLGCLHETFDKEGKCDRCNSSLSPHTCTIDNDYFKCVIRSAIFREIVRWKDNAYVAHIIVKDTCNNIHIPPKVRIRTNLQWQTRQEIWPRPIG